MDISTLPVTYDFGWSKGQHPFTLCVAALLKLPNYIVLYNKENEPYLLSILVLIFTKINCLIPFSIIVGIRNGGIIRIQFHENVTRLFAYCYCKKGGKGNMFINRMYIHIYTYVHIYVCLGIKIQKLNLLGAVMNFTMNAVYLLALQNREGRRERQTSSTRVLMLTRISIL